MIDIGAWLDRQRAARPWLDHLVRSGIAYSERNGNHYAAAITYFSVLSLFPMLMVAFSVAAFVLAGNPQLLTDLKDSITLAAPAGLGETLRRVVDRAVDSRGTVGILGLFAAFYSGLGWMGNLRDALTAQWDQEKPSLPIQRRIASDLLSLLGLGIALVISFGLTAVGTGAGSRLLTLVGLADDAWALFLLTVASIVLSLMANWLVFLWVLSRLPRERVDARSAMRGAVAAAIGFEAFKQVFTIYLGIVLQSPTGQLFGPIIGLLVFANLVARSLLFITAWTATATENLRPPVPRPPAPATIRPLVQVSRGPSARDVAVLVGSGAVLGLLLRNRGSRGRSGRGGDAATSPSR